MGMWLPEGFVLLRDTYRYSQKKDGTMGKIGLFQDYKKLTEAGDAHKPPQVNLHERGATSTSPLHQVP
jgi:hypothetical protein